MLCIFNQIVFFPEENISAPNRLLSKHFWRPPSVRAGDTKIKKSWSPPSSQAQASGETHSHNTVRQACVLWKHAEGTPNPARGSWKRPGIVHLTPELGLDRQIRVWLDELGGGRLSQAGKSVWPKAWGYERTWYMERNANSSA